MNTYDVNETVKLYALVLGNATVGTMIAGQYQLRVRDVDELSLDPGDDIVVVGAGEVGGDLVGQVVSVDGHVITLDERAAADVHATEVGNPVTDATVTCLVRHPDNTVETCSTALVGVRYKATVVPDADGDWYYRFPVSGSALTDGWKKFVVRPERVPNP